MKKNSAHERNNSNCKDSFALPLINDVTEFDKIQNSIIMIETSGNSYLSAR